MNPTNPIKRIVLAYSGSPKASAAILWLVETFGAEVVAVTLDLGQEPGLEAVRERALAAGARRVHLVDARDEFAEDFIVPALRAGAIDTDTDPLATALGRPLIARHLVRIARLEETHVVAHGGDRRGADGCRFDRLLAALDGSLVILSPVSEWAWSESDIAAALRLRGIRLPVAVPDVDLNLWGRTAEYGAGSDDDGARLVRPYVLTRPAAAAPDMPANVEVAFEEGVPVAVNDVPLSLVELISSLETIAGAHGVGRLRTADPDIGAGRRLAVEAPAAVVLHAAHRALQQYVTAPEVHRAAADRGADYATLVVRGEWYTAAREANDAFTLAVEKHVTGTARVKLFKGRSEVVGCRSPFALSHLEPDRPVGAGVSRS